MASTQAGETLPPDAREGSRAGPVEPCSPCAPSAHSLPGMTTSPHLPPRSDGDSKEELQEGFVQKRVWECGLHCRTAPVSL